MELSVKLQVFEGPLDLLLHLIDKNKINIYDIPVVQITDQYMEYLGSMEQTDLNTMSEFLVMAATLLDIKCRMLLPREINEDGEEEDPRAELTQQLLQYKMYKYMSYELKDREMNAELTFFRDPCLPPEVAAYEQPIDTESLLSDLTIEKLQGVFNEVMRRSVEKIDPVRSRFGKIEKEEVTLADKVAFVEEYSVDHSSFSFRDLLMKQNSKEQIIVTFLAVLELIKRGTIIVDQNYTFADIILKSA